MGIGMDRLIMYVTNNASIQRYCCFLKWDQRNKFKELEDDEN
jgi:lysyl-tRNA synthetase class II